MLIRQNYYFRELRHTHREIASLEDIKEMIALEDEKHNGDDVHGVGILTV